MLSLISKILTFISYVRNGWLTTCGYVVVVDIFTLERTLVLALGFEASRVYIMEKTD